jgi:hypothetical protein
LRHGSQRIVAVRAHQNSVLFSHPLPAS